MTFEQLTLDCEPNWTLASDTRSDTPTAAQVRFDELFDLRGQHATLYGLYTAATIRTDGRYL